MFVYHIRLLMKFLEDGEIRIRFFSLNSLKIMSTNVQKRIHFIDNTMHHHGLVKILLEFNLKSIEDSWDNFLIRNHFQDELEQPKENKTKKSRRRKIDTSIEDRPSPPLHQDEEELTLAELMKNKKQGGVKTRGKTEKKRKVTSEENLNPPQPKRISRLRRSMKKTPSQETEFVNLDKEPQVKSPINISHPHSPTHSPVHNFEGSPSRRYPGIDLV